MGTHPGKWLWHFVLGFNSLLTVMRYCNYHLDDRNNREWSSQDVLCSLFYISSCKPATDFWYKAMDSLRLWLPTLKFWSLPLKYKLADKRELFKPEVAVFGMLILLGCVKDWVQLFCVMPKLTLGWALSHHKQEGGCFYVNNGEPWNASTFAITDRLTVVGLYSS